MDDPKNNALLQTRAPGWTEEEKKKDKENARATKRKQ
jgi:hypothetical protein